MCVFQVENANADPTGFAISTISIFGLSFLFASFILFPIEERSSKVRHNVHVHVHAVYHKVIHMD